jgi:hypothetical protein
VSRISSRFPAIWQFALRSMTRSYQDGSYMSTLKRSPMDRTMLDHLIATVTETEIEYIASCDPAVSFGYGDAAESIASIRRVLFDQHGDVVDERKFAHEAVILCAGKLEEGHEREYALCTLLQHWWHCTGEVEHIDIDFELEQSERRYRDLPEPLRTAVFQAFADAKLANLARGRQ